MAKYDYSELKSAAAAGRRIGSWQGTTVYSCSRRDYERQHLDSPYFWVIYDDARTLVKQNKVYGTIDVNGGIDECAKYQYLEREKPTPKPASNPISRTTPASAYSAFMAGAKSSDVEVPVNVDDFFMKIDKEINELLASVSEVDLSVSFGVSANS